MDSPVHLAIYVYRTSPKDGPATPLPLCPHHRNDEAPVMTDLSAQVTCKNCLRYMQGIFDERRDTPSGF